MKFTLAVGLIIIFAGLVLTSSFASIQEQETLKQVVAHTTNSWTVSGYFEKGVNLTFEFRQHSDWNLLFYLELEDDRIYKKYLWINVTDLETGNHTMFRAALMVPLDSVPPGPPYAFNLAIYPTIPVTHHGALIVENSTRYVIGGIVNRSGDYAVKCQLEPEWVNDRDLQGNPWPHVASPPRDLYLYSVSNEKIHPYGSLLPLGIAVMAGGMVIAVLSVKAQKSKAQHRTIRRDKKA